MAEKNLRVILIHGMGEHEEEQFTDDFITPLEKAAIHFEALLPPRDDIQVTYIDYNDVIKDIRGSMKEATIDDLEKRFPGAPSVIAKINQLNNKFAASDSFWFTHILDVVLYLSLYSNAIQARVGTKLVEAMRDATIENQNIHIVCHSLGTLVGHDVLHKLYTNSLNDENGKLLLSAGLNKISSITMIANICGLLKSGAALEQSVVKPGRFGICEYFMTCRHVLDPFASIVRFKPPSSWADIQDNEFRNMVISGVERANVHDMDHYLNDFRVFMPFFMNLYPFFKTTSDELNKAKATHDATTVQGRFDTLKAYMENSDLTVYWDDAEGEFVFAKDAETIFEKLSEFLDLLESIKEEIRNLT